MSGAAQLGASLSSLGSAQNAQVEAMLKIKGKAKSAAGEFESMFLNSMFEQMNTKVDGDGPFGGSGAFSRCRSPGARSSAHSRTAKLSLWQTSRWRALSRRQSRSGSGW